MIYNLYLLTSFINGLMNVNNEHKQEANLIVLRKDSIYIPSVYTIAYCIIQPILRRFVGLKCYFNMPSFYYSVLTVSVCVTRACFPQYGNNIHSLKNS